MRAGHRARAALVALLAVVGLVAGAGELRAQEEPVDSTELRIRERLRRLGRAPGADSVLFIQDSVARAAATGRPSGAATDSTLQALFGMDGYAVTEYQGESADFEAGRRVLVLRAGEDGRAAVDRDGMRIEADTSITYDEATGRVRTVGASTLTPRQGDAVESGDLVYDLPTERASATDIRTRYRQGSAEWNVRGNSPYASADSTYLSHARFTSCDLEEPHYHFETDEIKIVNDNILVARPVRLYFADVPVAWLPFIAQSLSEGRSSGLLTPRFSVNDIVRTSGGYRRRVSNIGYYWAMSDYSDALLAMDWFSDTFVALNGSVRYAWNRQFLNGSLDFRQYWQAGGGTQQAINTRHEWEMDERTRLSARGAYASSSDFVRDNSFNPREVTQSIDSEGGIRRRFDWGSVNLGANRKQYMSDDRVEWTLPTAGLSLSTITLFRAPPSRAGFFNNMTWSGSARFDRRTVDRDFTPADTFSIGKANQTRTSTSVSSNLSLGRLTFSQNLDIQEDQRREIPEAWFVQSDAADVILTGQDPTRAFGETDLSWSTALNYQQQLIGSTTLTPSLSIRGQYLKRDTSSVATGFVEAPTRTSFGATLKTDIYGFFPGVGGFETIRHKFSPSFTYEWSPEVEPTELQRDFFGSRVLQPRNALAVTLNQTFEAKRAQDEAADSVSEVTDTLAEPIPDAGIGAAGDAPRRVERAEIVNLLALRTSVVRYDFVEADSIGSFLGGFQTTRLSNQISSDFLRGLTLSVEHDLFDEGTAAGEGGEGGAEGGAAARTFAPHLSSLNLSFALNNRSGIFNWIPFLGRDRAEGGEEVDEDELDDPDAIDPALDPLAEGVTNESSIVPTGASRGPARPGRRADQGGWNASLSYALQRPRSDQATVSQVLNGTLTLRPTDQWDLTWRTSYDLERSEFNDHTIRLSRDLHRWRANFDFLQTATGNWTFRFEVSLIDNQDLKFDYEQRNLDAGRPASQRR